MHNNKKFNTWFNLAEFVHLYDSEFFINTIIFPLFRIFLNNISLHQYPTRIGIRVHRQQEKASNAS